MDWKEMVGSVAPILGTALGGPFGGMAGKFLAGKLGVDDKTLESTIAEADPNLMLKIKKLDASFETEMKKLGITQEQLHADDRADARKMATNTTLMPQAIISTIFIIGFVATLYAVFTGHAGIDSTMKNASMYLLGILSAGIIQIMNFWFGSSSGSKEKTLQMSKTK